jgi:hypothetical protein
MPHPKPSIRRELLDDESQIDFRGSLDVRTIQVILTQSDLYG